MRLKQPGDCFALSFLSTVDMNCAKVLDMWPNYLKMLEEIWLYLAIYCLPKGWVHQSNHYLISHIVQFVFCFVFICLFIAMGNKRRLCYCFHSASFWQFWSTIFLRLATQLKG